MKDRRRRVRGDLEDGLDGRDGLAEGVDEEAHHLPRVVLVIGRVVARPEGLPHRVLNLALFTSSAIDPTAISLGVMATLEEALTAARVAETAITRFWRWDDALLISISDLSFNHTSSHQILPFLLDFRGKAYLLRER